MDVPQLTFYQSNGFCSRVPHILLLELGVPFKRVRMTFNESQGGLVPADGSLSREEYLKRVHPAGYVPALQVDETVITELPAILSYIDFLARKQDKIWFPRDGLEGAKAMEWVAWLSNTVQAGGIAGFFGPKRFSDDPSAHAGISAKARKQLDVYYRQIENKLEANGAAGLETDHALNNQFSVVDVYLYQFWTWGKTIQISNLDQAYPRLKNVARKVEALKSARDTVIAEESPLLFA